RLPLGQGGPLVVQLVDAGVVLLQIEQPFEGAAVAHPCWFPPPGSDTGGPCVGGGACGGGGACVAGVGAVGGGARLAAGGGRARRTPRPWARCSAPDRG